MNASPTPQACVTAGYSAVLLARIVDWEATLLARADVLGASYTIFELDDRDPASRTAVSGHENVALSTTELDAAIFDELQLGDARWTVDGRGYNFRFQPSADTAAPFPTPGRAYLAAFTFSPTAGEDFPVQWRLQAL